MIIPCVRCQVGIEFEIQAPKVINLRHGSLILVEHDGEVECANCKQTLVPVVGSINSIQMQTTPVDPSKPKQRSALIVPGGFTH